MSSILGRRHYEMTPSFRWSKRSEDLTDKVSLHNITITRSGCILNGNDCDNALTVMCLLSVLPINYYKY